MQDELRSGRRYGHLGRTFGGAITERIAAVQGGPDGSLQGGKDRALVAKANLPLRGMHVDVDELGIDADVDHRNRVPPTLEPALVALLEGIDQGTGTDRAAIDREHHPIAAAPAQPGLADQTGDV